MNGIGGDMMKAAELIKNHKDYENNTYNTEKFYLDYVALEQSEIEKLIHLVVEDDSLDDMLKKDMLKAVALYSYGEDYSYTKFDSRIFDYLIAHNINEPWELYYRAKDDVSLKLIKEWEKDLDTYKKQKDFGLSCFMPIIAIPCESTKDFLLEHCDNCSRDKLDDFTCFAGWYINKQCQIEKLYDDKVIVLEECSPEESSNISPMRMIAENCPNCEDDYAPSSLYLIFDGEYKMPFCYSCPVEDTFFTKEVGGKIVVLGHEDKVFEPKLHAGKSDTGLRVVNEKRMATYSAGCLSDSVRMQYPRNQIGGMPTSVNDVYYPKCPVCGERMHFVGQYEVDNNMFYYFFTCEKCKTHASTYDQS